MAMSNSAENGGFDVEAQKSLLVDNQEQVAAAEGERGSKSSSSSVHAKNEWKRCILVIRSTLVFMSRAHHYAADFTSSSDYASLSISDDDNDRDSGSAAAFDDSFDDGGILSAHLSSPANTELQQIQSERVAEIVKKKNLQELGEYGGVRGVAEALNSDLENGRMISIPFPPPVPTSQSPCKLSRFLLNNFFNTFLESCNNLTVFLLSCAAALSLGFGIKEDGLHNMGWFNGVVLLATVAMIVVCTTARKCWEKWSNNIKSQLGRKLDVQILRGGNTGSVGEVDIEVGDIAFLRKGDQLPADGLFLGSGDECLQLDDASIINEANPFMFYGSKVVNGDGRMLVTSTGTDTVWGEMMSQAAANKDCNVECYLNKLFDCLHILGLLISILIIVVLFLRYKAGKLDDERRYRPDSKGEPTQLKTFVEALKAIITGSKGTARVLTTLLSVPLLGIMEGVPLVISVSILVWNRKTLAAAYMALELRDSFACINIPHLTTICTDISGGMTAHHLEIDKLYVGDGFVSPSSTLPSQLVEALHGVIAAPICPPAVPPSQSGAADHVDIDPKLECLLSWAESDLGMNRSLIVQSKINSPLNTHEHFQVLKDKNGNRGYLHCKGPPDRILSVCSHHYGIDGQIREMDGERKRKLQMDIQLAFLAMISMRKTSTEATKVAVEMLKEEGIRTILASGEQDSVLRAIAEKCGLLTTNSDDDDQVVVTGENFRELRDDDRLNMIEKICIMANCTPDDKFLLIKCLKERGRVVALVAQRTVDAPALKLADIGITYGSSRSTSEIVKDCSEITLRDGKYCFLGLLVNVIKSGRSFLENIRKFIQLQLIFSISSSLINFTATVALGDAPITAVQLFWLNLVVALVGGLALLTEPPVTVMSTAEMPPKKVVIITRDMLRNIGVQVFYQTGVFVVLQHKGLGGMIYNGFFLCQMFNLFIARQPRKKNIFSGVFHSWFWMALILFPICQAAFAVAEEFLGSCRPLDFKLWGVCLLIAFVSWPLDLLAKMLL
ncbi:hypothetical protein C2S51_008627 [Perilla frutescens var. frutescens]|nr:hypothetical protein C2S51_008627 [Perilla frutescens var. frutescens]